MLLFILFCRFFITRDHVDIKYVQKLKDKEIKEKYKNAKEKKIQKCSKQEHKIQEKKWNNVVTACIESAKEFLKPSKK